MKAEVAKAMSQPTPGPWYARESADVGEWEVYADGRMICHLTDAHGDAEANARLIAQAPAMREALKALTDAVSKVSGVGYPIPVLVARKLDEASALLREIEDQP